MDWREKAIKLLKDSLYPIPIELNELDWKSGISDKSERLAQHISAFANTKGGGILVYGVNNDGTCFSLTKGEVDKIVQTLGNIAHNNLAYSIPIEHSVIEFDGHSLLFVYIPEQGDKPVYLRGKDIYTSYYRSAGQTVKMSRPQVKALIASSLGITFEEQIAQGGLKKDDVLNLLDYKALYRILDKNVPQSTDSIIERLADYNLCKQIGKDWAITNLGAILFANELQDFPNIVGHEVIVRKYVGTNNRQQEFEQHTRVFLYPQKSLKDMTKHEKIAACYQHACLMYEDGEKINNQSVRARFELSKNDSSIASRIISDTLEAGLIKPADIETASKKYMTYIPYYG